MTQFGRTGALVFGAASTKHGGLSNGKAAAIT
jgi:hypothetical protein